MGPPGDLSAAALHIVERDGPSVPLLASASTEASPSSVPQGRVSKLKESLVLLHEMGDSHLEAIPSLPKFSYVILPPTSVKPVGMLTVPSERLWSPSWGGL